jgi:hypothetical protein
MVTFNIIKLCPNRSYDQSVPVITALHFLRLWMNDLQYGNIADILNTHSRTAENWRSCSLGVGRGAKDSLAF